MKRFAKVVLLAGITASVMGCASIVNGGRQPVNINSTPSGASIEIVDRNDRVVYEGTTPTTVRLQRGDGYFRSQNYRVTFTASNGATKTVSITSSVNGAYIFGNILLGGFIGWLIVDPISGGMYNLRPRNLTEEVAMGSDGTLEIRVALLENLDSSLFEDHDLIPIN